MAMRRMMRAGVGVTCLLACGIATACAPGEPAWVPLFDGRSLDGWTPKISGYPLGEDPMGTFRVEDGLLTVGYERYGEFGDRFGHLFYEEPYSDYRLLIEYRFVGEQAPGGPAWALRNSGVMVHAQAPETMTEVQDFPISVEVQFLGGNGEDERPTANVCTPGTEIVMNGAPVPGHCTDSSSRTFHGEEWVTTEITVLGDSLFVHVVAGDTVLTYGDATIGGGVVNGYDPAVKPDGAVLSRGYIALQSESHPIQFRRVLLQLLEGG
jgi:hypothetical protein